MRHPTQPLPQRPAVHPALKALAAALTGGSLLLPLAADAASSYAPVNSEESFSALRARYVDMKPGVERRHRSLLEQRYDLGDKPGDLAMTRGKRVQTGVRVRLPAGVASWEALTRMSPEQIKERDLFPAGFLPLPHPHHAEGGMLFPQFHIDKVMQQDGRDLKRFDLSYDLPDHLLPEYPPAIFLTTRKDLGDVSRGQVVTLANYFELFDGVLNPKQLEGLRLLVTPFPQQQFNATADRRSDKPSQGVTCFDCHVNGHTNASTHLVGDIRPQEFRHRLDTPSLRGVNIQRLFGSQRALKTVEDFTEFEQRAAYFDGDPVIATKKGVNILERGSQVHFMGEFQALLDFPPAPKLDLLGKLVPAKASASELRGQDVFFGKGQCASCHTPPFYTDNLMHDLQAERFFTPRDINGRMAAMDGPIKTFPLRGLKESPPYLHDGRLLTIEDTVEYFNLVLGVQLSSQEKADLVAFLRTL
ncbi:cytochrome B6 [Azoarcus indigens]|uniref:Cytochrome c peroxidase n=1 Tax=Azoarcus indigens TaxID=29545 RepID=A0A4R6E1E2_9RHOO|nr:cytochrome B6 [Azoarcus indigens]NMG64786.1 cytochrome B6 [Azoarcus indigens]TDN50829.1 cytochrome c peroxidase [Azoarcus indigens]